MEMSLNKCFCELTVDEMAQVDGGEITAAGVYDAACMAITASAAGAIASSFVPAGPVAYMTAAVTMGVVGYIWENV